MAELLTADPKSPTETLVEALEYGGKIMVALGALAEFYEPNESMLWLTSPQSQLAGRRPCDLYLTEDGANEVAAVINRLRDGAFV